MKLNYKSLVMVLAAALLALGAIGCKNTAEGMGEDIEKAGEKIQEKVD